MITFTTLHFEERFVERRSRTNVSKFVKDCVEKGLYLNDINPDSSLYEYLSNKATNGCQPIVYKGYILIQSEQNNTCITLLKVPKKFDKKVKKAIAYKKKKGVV